MKEIYVEVTQLVAKRIIPKQALDVRLSSSPARLYLAQYSESEELGTEPTLYEQGKAVGELLTDGICTAFKDGLLNALDAERKPAS
jgi:hypothetical protein